jgi:RNA polymerase sigma factor FliA
MTSIALPRETRTARGRRRTTPAAQNELVAKHLGLVYHVAKQIARGRSTEIELDELVSAGTLGLIDAVTHFDATRGLAFSTFAAPRIRGAMLDELRRQDRVPRSVRRRTREVNAAVESLTRTLGRAPQDAELGQALGVDAQTVRRWQTDAERATHLPLDGESSGHELPLAPEMLGSAGDDVIAAIVAREEIEQVRDAILELGEQERTVLTLYYFEELKLSDIARILGVSESRVSQVRSRAIERLRGLLGVDTLRPAS